MPLPPASNSAVNNDDCVSVVTAPAGSAPGAAGLRKRGSDLGDKKGGDQSATLSIGISRRFNEFYLRPVFSRA
jgi:hypothetical protein